jgi:hypothetical protein
MKHNPSWETNSRLATPYIPNVLWNFQVSLSHSYDLVTGRILRQIQSILQHTIYPRTILMFSFHLDMGHSSGFFPFRLSD